MNFLKPGYLANDIDVPNEFGCTAVASGTLLPEYRGSLSETAENVKATARADIRRQGSREEEAHGQSLLRAWGCQAGYRRSRVQWPKGKVAHRRDIRT
ncbi:hypothetical protein [Burkholderia savannae]|uniref:hypothetical protein n=1 Tax=Burkholderia savannae TaxID=1637837 RepID=UPI0012E338F2|nr:hypothetical protein [Burkholderia savannae]